jgi:hypothetical protein
MRKFLLATMFSLAAGAAYADPPDEQVPTMIDPSTPARKPVAKPDDRRAPVDPYMAGTRCLDGWLSPVIGAGACAQHGGIMHGGPVPLPPKVPPRPTPDPIGPTSQIGTRCLDGTIAMTSDRTACARHGGVMRGKPIPPARS